MALNKKLETGTCVRAWNYESENIYKGMGLGIKDKNGAYPAAINIESVHCAEGLVNRIIINKTRLKEAGFTIVEE